MADKTERRIRCATPRFQPGLRSFAEAFVRWLCRALEEEVVELRQRVAALDGLGPKEPGTEPPGAANGHGSITAL